MITLMRRLLPTLLLLFTLPTLVPAAEPDVAGLLSEARAQILAYEYREAERIYLEMLEVEPGQFEALLGLGRAAAGVGEDPRATGFYAAAAEADPSRPEPAQGMGYLANRLDRREEARRWYERALELDPEHPASLAGLARVAIEDKDFEAADDLLKRAESVAEDYPSVLSARSEYLFRQGDMDGSVRLLRRQLAVNPMSLGANLRLATGFIEKGRVPPPPPEVPPQYALEVERGTVFYRRAEFEAAQAVFSGLDPENAPDGRAAFYLGLIQLRRGQPRQAIPLLRNAVRIEPENPLFRNALSVAIQTLIQSQRAEYGGGEDPRNRLGELAKRLPAEPVPGIEKIVRGYERLLPAERRVIDRAAKPLSRYLYFLQRERVTHDILGFEQGMCDAPERRYLNRRTTHDGRWYGGVRGIGGRNAATGQEAILAATELRYDTFAHELSHQVHQYGFSETEKKMVTELFRRAVLFDRCLDYYAASNEREYLAQGYEAFVSLVKSPFSHHIRRHTRAELRERDPGLFRFLLRVTGTPDPDPTLRPLAAPILAFYEWSGDETALQRARTVWLPYTAPSAGPR
jgi:tetratricopeptide (TPR) repeat protein